MALEWQEEYSVGVDKIDDQHKELIERTRKFSKAIETGKDRHKVKYLLNFLKDFAEEHFETEEEIMKEKDYPGLPEHRRKHLEFFDTVEDMEKELEEDGSSQGFSLEVQRYLIDWLNLHLTNMDEALGEYLEGSEGG